MRQLCRPAISQLLWTTIFGHRQVPAELPYQADLGDYAQMVRILEQEQIELVMHFAAFAYVGESVSDPLKYYEIILWPVCAIESDA